MFGLPPVADGEYFAVNLQSVEYAVIGISGKLSGLFRPFSRFLKPLEETLEYYFCFEGSFYLSKLLKTILGPSEGFQ